MAVYVGKGAKKVKNEVEAWWSPEYLAACLGIPVRTIYSWRYRGEGPKGYRIGRHVRYRPEDVESWLEAHADNRVENHA